MTANGGTAWFLWRGDGEVEPRRGTGVNGKVGDNAIVPTTETQTLTIQLDLSGWDGASDFGTFGVYDGTSSTGTLLYSGDLDYDFTADTNFLAAGFSTAQQSGKINSFTLTQQSVVPEPSTISLLAIAAVGGIAVRRRRRRA